VYYRAEYGMFNVVIWGNGISYDDSKSFLLGYASHGAKFDAAKFANDYNVCFYGAAIDRNMKRRANASNDNRCQRVAELVNTLNEARAELIELLDDDPDSCTVGQLVVDQYGNGGKYI
jgi:hypothetical protein